MLRSLAFAVLALSACAPASPELSPGTRDSTLLVNDGTVNIRTSERSVAVDVPLAAEQAWAALPAAYEALGLRGGGPAGERLFGVPRMEASRALNGVRLSRYLDCGATVSVPNADSYAVTLQVSTRLTPVTGSSTRVETLVQGTARPRDTSGNPVACTSTGALERQIAEKLRPAGP
ncbi:MAG TPA: hypothetical protein VGR37_05800 [Longimicrobiaceae bacterium]|nr:hypothetical protein [Longimicrobiaceae bacterium]